METILSIKNLNVVFKTEGASLKAVNNVSLSLKEGEILGIVGESGSGKTVLTQSVLKLLPDTAKVTSDSIALNGAEIKDISSKDFINYRGKVISAIFQDPMSALSPTVKIGTQLKEVFKRHFKMNDDEARKESIDILKEVGINDPETRMRQYPFELSGGMLQRVVIAIALSCKPKLLIADEPTTALDVTTQAQILKLIRNLSKRFKTSVIFITHDLSVVSKIADRVIVMKDGVIRETASIEDIFANPKDEYTKLLLSSLPDRGFNKKNVLEDLDIEKNSVEKNQDRKILEVKNLTVKFNSGIFRKKKIQKAVNDVSFSIHKGEVFSIVGESGCGKSTLSKAILNLNHIDNGEVIFKNKIINPLSQKLMREIRPEIQLIFQTSASLLNPRMTINELLEAPLSLKRLKRQEKKDIINKTMKAIGLDESYLSKFPHELSGGQKQRIIIANAIINNPDLVVCDEPVSALDVTVQKQILELLSSIREKYNLTYLFISHDLNVVKSISNRIAVMYMGEFVEEGSTNDIFKEALHPYTKLLLDSIPYFENKEYFNRDESSKSNIEINENMCKFYNRCPKRSDICLKKRPKIRTVSMNHKVACLNAEK